MTRAAKSTHLDCPDCSARMVAVDTRNHGHYRRRRYLCDNGHRHTTVEVIVKRGDVLEVSNRRGALFVGQCEQVKRLAARIVRLIGEEVA